MNTQTKIIATGAESEIHQITKTTLKKIRLEKTYRIPEIDTKLRKSRNRREFKVLTKLYENNILVPKPYKLIEDKRIDEISFEFEYINGQVLKNCLTKNSLNQAFNEIIKIHKLEITHGDLTTLNMIKQKTTNKIYIIDFGLSEFTTKAEDRAVDLNLFFNCIKNEHPNFYKHKEQLLKIYEKEIDKKTIKSLNNLELRGRNKKKLQK